MARTSAQHYDRRGLRSRYDARVHWTLLVASLAGQGQPPPAPAPPTPFEILDNSFLVEEAFNQEARIFQNIFGFFRAKDGWDLAFTQEWPIRSQAHQFSFTLPFAGAGGQRGIGDVMINYRLPFRK